ncbi:MAG: tetratricopeptide repeat protein [Ktedonobacterales bacterium]
MGTDVALPVVVTVLGTIAAAVVLGAARILYIRWTTPSPQQLFQRAAQSKEVALHVPDEDGRRLLMRALDAPDVREVLENESFGPDAEVEAIGQALVRLAPAGSPLAGAERADRLARALVRAEFVTEGRYKGHLARSDRRRAYFAQPATAAARAGAPVVVTTAPTQIVPGSFFVPLEYLRGRARSLVGREPYLAQLRRDFMDASYHLVVIEGFGGIGKTTLAARLAADVSDRYSILWVDCTPAITAERILHEVGRFAADECAYPLLATVVANLTISEAEKVNALIEFLSAVGTDTPSTSPLTARHPIAFFFDDYHLVKDPSVGKLIERVADALVDAKVALVVRHRLNLSARLQEQIDAADAILLDGLSLEDCRDLLTQHAAKFPALAHLDDHALLRVWKRTGQGVPNALKILISLTRKRSLHDVLEQLPDYDPLTVAGKEWYDSLFGELSAEEQGVMTEVAVLRRPATRETVRHVSRSAQVDELLDELVDRFVMTFDGDLYALHALWSEYAVRRLGPEELLALHLRAAVYYRDVALDDRYGTVMSQLESCYHFTKAGDLDQAIAVIVPVADTLRAWGLFQELTDILDEIEAADLSTGRTLDPQLQMEKSAVLYARGEVQRAVVILDELIAQSSGTLRIKALQSLAWINTELGDRLAAEELYQRSRRLATEEHDDKLEGEAVHGLQHIAYFQGEYAKVLEYNQELLTIYQRLGNNAEAREAIAWTYHNIGNVYREQAKYDQALKLYQQDLDLWHAAGDPPWHVGWITYDIGQIYYERGMHEEAEAQFEEALRLFERAHYLIGIAHVKIELGRNASKLRSLEASVALIDEAIAMLRKVGMVSGIAYGTRALGEIYLNHHDADRALPYLEQGMNEETALHNLKGIAWSEHRIGLAYEMQANRLLVAGEAQRACELLAAAAASIARGQALFARIDAVPNYRGIRDDAERVTTELAACK